MRNLLKIDIDKNRIFGLDLLRAFAILGVVAQHGNELLPLKISNFLTKLLFFDWVGIFFVLSGFLVGGIFIRAIEQMGLNKKVLMIFWIRRWLRTLPAYFFVFLILLIIQIVLHPAFSMISVWKYLFFLQNLNNPIPQFFIESWSLCVEEWFYLAVPVFVGLFMVKRKITLRQSLLLVAVLIITCSTGIRLHRYFEYYPNGTFDTYIFQLRLQVLTRLDGIMYGVLAALWHHYHHNSFVKYKNGLAVLSLVIWCIVGYLRRFYPENVGVYMSSIYWWVFDFSVWCISTVCVLPFLTKWKTANGFLYQCITRASILSYSMYLLNATLIQGVIINTLIPWNSYFENVHIITGVKYLLYWLLVFCLSIVMYKYIELPLIKLRNHRTLNFFSNN